MPQVRGTAEAKAPPQGTGARQAREVRPELWKASRSPHHPHFMEGKTEARQGCSLA